ncbi:hypothetical protein PISL3812_00882 [Talaromyces islandicus]|uniref:FAS1 domain-containing protein n=1 Tax=Talaromyces islandicus TaxID=28573 RepID=A0A0U1LMK5_TALIS|nr:hypothetical protein PISL3812_00882 [Talaromyces islandicus]
MPRLINVVYQVTRAAFAVAVFALGTQIYIKAVIKDIESHASKNSVSTTSIASNVLGNDSSQHSLTELIFGDTSLSRLQRILAEMPPPYRAYFESHDKLTVFAPVDEAYDLEKFDWDNPDFYWMYLEAYHYVIGNFSLEDLAANPTLPTVLWADIYASYRQRISIQVLSPGTVKLNHRATIVKPSLKAKNGYLHYVDRVIMMPVSTAYVTRHWPEFSLLRQGLDHTGLAVIVNDTSTHNGQTFFAPSNRAFEKLGKDVTDFLFGPWGRDCFRALLEYHVIANETLFTDSHFKANGRGPGLINNEVAPGFELNMSTMIRPLQLKAHIHHDKDRGIGKIQINDEVDVTQPDIVVQDGVIHKIDDIILPPKLSAGTTEDGHGSTSAWDRLRVELLRPKNTMTVENLLQRFQPYLQQTL